MCSVVSETGRIFYQINSLKNEKRHNFVVMIQSIIVILSFMLALIYVGRLAYKSFFRAKAGECASGCGKCGAVDFAKLEKELKQKGF